MQIITQQNATTALSLLLDGIKQNIPAILVLAIGYAVIAYILKYFKKTSTIDRYSGVSATRRINSSRRKLQELDYEIIQAERLLNRKKQKDDPIDLYTDHRNYNEG